MTTSLPKLNDFWNTPPLILDAVTKFLGDGWYDPCPANPTFDGLKVSWTGNCHLNPPYSHPLFKKFIAKAYEEFKPELCRYVWTLNYGNTKNLKFIKLMSSAVCLPHDRIKFIPGHPDLKVSTPKYNNIIVLWGNPVGFKEAFGHIGEVFEKKKSPIIPTENA